MAPARGEAVKRGKPSRKHIAWRGRNWPVKVAQVGNCFSNQFEVPVMFYILIALALPLRHADLFIVLMSWVFVATRFIHAGIFVASNDLGQRSSAWLAGVEVLLVSGIYFAP